MTASSDNAWRANTHAMIRGVVLAASFLVFAWPWVTVRAQSDAATPDLAQFRAWIQAMKTSPKGPFSGITWFCKDGTTVPSVPGKGYGCANHGGGVQHGEWNEHTRTLRAAGYLIANLLVGLDPDKLLAPANGADTVKQILLEQYLIAADDGWILRGARYYRGALQTEDERKGARHLLRAMLARPDWRHRRFALLREAARLLPHEAQTRPVTEMRQLSSLIAERDPGFTRLRDKIHSRPDAADAAAVRRYAEHGLPAVADEYGRLAAAIDHAYRVDASASVIALASGVAAPLAKTLIARATRLSPGTEPGKRYAAAATLMAVIREHFDQFGTPGRMLDALDASLALETELYATGNVLWERLGKADRAARLRWLASDVEALYGTGLLSTRERAALKTSFTALAHHRVGLDVYEEQIHYLGRVPQWADRTLRFYFSPAVDHYAEIEPKTRLYFHDRLRASPLLFYGAVVDSLQVDADDLAGVKQRIFDRRFAGEVRALNPGLARGVLRVGGAATAGSFDPNGIYILPQSLADLPPVAGIITAGAGNPVSHVQLLARNLGIPNVAVSAALAAQLRRHAGERVVLAVSPLGTVRLGADGPQWDRVFGKRQTPTDVLIKPDLAKLDLKRRDPISLTDLRASDSGRLAGPKAANLAELKHHYPHAVADGVVVPFGVFRHVLDRPLEGGGPSVWQWMRAQYAALAREQRESAKRTRAAAAFLARLRHWIQAQALDPDFVRELRKAMASTFGADGSYGVFVRSDTNVEDLPGFTGAGLNLTVPNVVGFDNVLKAITRVWASPFTGRAYGWRQARMGDPMQVYPSVLLLRSVPVEKSGVMVTRDVDTGARGWVSVAVNEGIGGAVSDQAAEDLRINLSTGGARLMAQATAPEQRVLDPRGGLETVPASGADYVLTARERAQLVAFARGLPAHFPAAREARGGLAPMDVEFGFLHGKLVLFQIRPYAQSKGAQRNAYLLSLDAQRRPTRGRTVDLRARP